MHERATAELGGPQRAQAHLRAPASRTVLSAHDAISA
jgi:hypothetical protein